MTQSDKVAQLYSSGLTVREVSDKLGMPQHQVYNTLRREGVELRRVKAVSGMTDKQRDVFSYVAGYISAHNRPPTRQEIADYFNFSSANAAEDHLKAIARKGFISLTRGKARGIKIVIPA